MRNTSRARQHEQALANPYAMDEERRGRPGVTVGVVVAGAAGLAVIGAGTASADPGSGDAGSGSDPVSSTSYRQIDIGSGSDAADRILSVDNDVDVTFDVSSSGRGRTRATSDPEPFTWGDSALLSTAPPTAGPDAEVGSGSDPVSAPEFEPEAHPGTGSVAEVTTEVADPAAVESAPDAGPADRGPSPRADDGLSVYDRMSPESAGIQAADVQAQPESASEPGQPRSVSEPAGSPDATDPDPAGTSLPVTDETPFPAGSDADSDVRGPESLQANYVWPPTGETTPPIVFLGSSTRIDQIPPHPAQAAILDHLDGDGAEALRALRSSEYSIGDDADWSRAVVSVAEQLRQLSIGAPPVSPERAGRLFPTSSEAADPVHDEDRSNAEAQRVVGAGPSGLTSPETLCWLVCDAQGNATVPDQVVVGEEHGVNLSPDWPVAPGAVRDATRWEIIHTHPFAGGESAGLSDGDRSAAEKRTQRLRDLGSAAELGVTSIETLTGTVTRGVPRLGTDQWDLVQVMQGGAGPVTDRLNMAGHAVRTAGRDVERPLPLDIVPDGTSSDLVRQTAAHWRRSWREVGEDFRRDVERDYWDARLAVAGLVPRPRSPEPASGSTVPDAPNPPDGAAGTGAAGTGVDGQQDERLRSPSPVDRSVLDRSSGSGLVMSASSVGGSEPHRPDSGFLRRLGLLSGADQGAPAGGGGGSGDDGRTDRRAEGGGPGVPYVYRFDGSREPDFRRVSPGEELGTGPTVYVGRDQETGLPIYAFSSDDGHIGMNTAYIDPALGTTPEDVTLRRGGYPREDMDSPGDDDGFVVPVPVGDRAEPMDVGIEVPPTEVPSEVGPEWFARPYGGGSFLNCSVAGCDFAFAEDGSLAVARRQPDGTVQREWRPTTTPPDRSQAQPTYGRWEFDEERGTLTYRSDDASSGASPPTTHMTVLREPRGGVDRIEVEGGAGSDPAMDTLGRHRVPGTSYRMVASPTEPYDNLAEGTLDGVPFDFGSVAPITPEEWWESITPDSLLSSSYKLPEPSLGGVINGEDVAGMTPRQVSDRLEALGLPPTVNPGNVVFDPDSAATASPSFFDQHVTLLPDNSIRVMDPNGTVYVYPAVASPARSADGGVLSGPADGTPLARVVMPDGTVEYRPTTTAPTIGFRRPGSPGTSQGGGAPSSGDGGGGVPSGGGGGDLDPSSPDPVYPRSDSEPGDAGVDSDDRGVSGGLVVWPEPGLSPEEQEALGPTGLPGGGVREPATPEIPTGLPPSPREEGLGSNDAIGRREVPPVDLGLDRTFPTDDRQLEAALYPNGVSGPTFSSPLGQEDQSAPADGASTSSTPGSPALSLSADDARGMAQPLTPQEVEFQRRLAIGATAAATVGLALTPIPGDEAAVGTVLGTLLRRAPQLGAPAMGAAAMGAPAMGAVVVPVSGGSGDTGGTVDAAEDPVSSGPILVDPANPVTERNGDEVAVANNEDGTTTYVDGGPQVFQSAPIPDVGRFALVTEPDGDTSAQFVPVESEPERAGFGGAFVASPTPDPPDLLDEYVPTFAEDSFLGALTALDEQNRRSPMLLSAPSEQSSPGGAGFVASPALTDPDESGLLGALAGMDGTGAGSGYPDCSVAGQVRCVTPGTNELRVGPDGPTERDPEGRTVARYDECAVPGQVKCLVPGTNTLLVGDGSTRVDGSGRTVARERECGSAAEVGCVEPGTDNSRRVGTGQPQWTDGEGRTFEVATPAAPAERYTPEYGEWALGQIGAPPDAGARSPARAPAPVDNRFVEGAGRLWDGAVDAVQHPVESVGNAVDWVGEQARRAREAAGNLWDAMPWNR